MTISPFEAVDDLIFALQEFFMLYLKLLQLRLDCFLVKDSLHLKSDYLKEQVGQGNDAHITCKYVASTCWSNIFCSRLLLCLPRLPEDLTRLRAALANFFSASFNFLSLYSIIFFLRSSIASFCISFDLDDWAAWSAYCKSSKPSAKHDSTIYLLLFSLQLLNLSAPFLTPALEAQHAIINDYQ